MKIELPSFLDLLATRRLDRQRFVNDELSELQNIGCGFVGETLGSCQLGNSVDHRPCKKCKLTEVSGGQSSFILAAFDQAHQRPERLFCSFGRIGSLVFGNGCVEHNGEVLLPTTGWSDMKVAICNCSLGSDPMALRAARLGYASGKTEPWKCTTGGSG